MNRIFIAALSIFIVAAAQSCGSPVAAQSQGPAGPQGPPGVSGYEVVRLDQTLLPGGATPVVVSCPAGKAALSGVYVTASTNFPVLDSAPGATKADWRFFIRNNSGSAASVSVYAICAIAN
jgi:hypothetical protein